ncbi:MAG: hypothetical protein M3044_06725 [Thermoproteota archaeon]|nr:hypothetical protein [Thermoproteota archaeon]
MSWLFLLAGLYPTKDYENVIATILENIEDVLASQLTCMTRDEGVDNDIDKMVSGLIDILVHKKQSKKILKKDMT